MSRFSRPRAGAVLGTLVTLAAARAGFAHHSVAGEFDVHKKLSLVGIVSQVDWANPHIYVHLAVKDGHGGVTEWRLETVPVAMMRKAGLSKTKLLGNSETARVDAYPARDGTPHLGYLLMITYADGHHYQFAPDSPAPPAK
ncbi:MAG TPA: DUF6152 family protein [Steroidobacteraceae bacterium]|nr:DUF6152 family protein [Steroidobacteraceae bacterium]